MFSFFIIIKVFSFLALYNKSHVFRDLKIIVF